MNLAKSPSATRRSERRSSRVLLRLFPSSWRDRYGEEFAALLDDVRLRPGTLFDVLVLAVEARLRPHQPPRRFPVTERFRRSELVVFASWIAFAVAGAGFAKLTEDPPFTTLRSTAGPVDIAFDVLLAGAWLSFFGVLVAGVPIALSIAADAIRRRKVVQLALLATPIGAMAIWGLITIVLATRGVPAAGDPMRYIVVGGWFAAFLVAVAVSTLAVSVAALNAEVDGRVYRRAVWPAFVTVAGMTVVTLAALGWAVAVLSSDASAFWSFQGLLASSTALTWLVIFVTMLVATVAALRAARRLRSDAV